MESNALIELFSQMISESAFYYLRTKEKLGYIVRSGVRVTNGIQGVFIQVQSNNNSRYVENKIEEFIDSVEVILFLKKFYALITIQSSS